MRPKGKPLAADDYVQLTPIGVPMDVAMERAFAKLGYPMLGGTSGNGWSRHALFMSCPKRHYLANVKKRVEVGPAEDKEGLAIGAAFHAFIALHYQGMIAESGVPDPRSLREALYDERASAQFVSEGWRLYDSYRFRYENDYLTPLAVETLTQGKRYTARHDLVARVEPNETGIAPGVYLVQSKTAASNNETTRDGWRNDGGVLTEFLTWREAKLDRFYGELRGVLMNIVVKTQTVQFVRTVIAPNWARVAEHGRELRRSEMEEAECRRKRSWPMRGRAHGCIFRYGKCEFYEDCSA